MRPSMRCATCGASFGLVTCHVHTASDGRETRNADAGFALENNLPTIAVTLRRYPDASDFTVRLYRTMLHSRRFCTQLHSSGVRGGTDHTQRNRDESGLAKSTHMDLH